MTRLDSYILAGQWIHAIKEVRTINDAKGQWVPLRRAIFWVALRAKHLGVLHSAPRRFYVVDYYSAA
jgi:hypothetical protein